MKAMLTLGLLQGWVSLVRRDCFVFLRDMPHWEAAGGTSFGSGDSKGHAE